MWLSPYMREREGGGGGVLRCTRSDDFADVPTMDGSHET